MGLTQATQGVLFRPFQPNPHEQSVKSSDRAGEIELFTHAWIAPLPAQKEFLGHSWQKFSAVLLIVTL